MRRSRLTKPLATFEVQAERRTLLVFRVVVWDDRTQLNLARAKARRSAGQNRDGVSADAFTYVYYRRHVDDRVLGEIHLSRQDLTLENIAHECVHAAIALALWFRHCSVVKTKEQEGLSIRDIVVEEAIAYPAGYMTELIVAALAGQGFRLQSQHVK